MADDRAGSIPASPASGSEVAPIADKSGSMRVAARRGLRRLAGQRDWPGGCNAVSGPGDLHDEMPGSPAPADPGAHVAWLSGPAPLGSEPAMGPPAPAPVAVDAMGGDRAPEEIVAGARSAAAELGIPVVLIGDPERIGDAGGLDVVPAREVIEMHEDPAKGVRR